MNENKNKNKNKNKKMKGIGIAAFILIQLAGIFYVKTTAKIYRVNSKVVLLRSMIPPADMVTPEPNNRWVWVRDGLALKESILSDSFLLKLRQDKELSARELSESEFFKNLRKTFSFNQDSNKYLIGDSISS